MDDRTLLERDAQRYRWLLANVEDVFLKLEVGFTPPGSKHFIYVRHLGPSDLSAAIDAASLAEGEAK